MHAQAETGPSNELVLFQSVWRKLRALISLPASAPRFGSRIAVSSKADHLQQAQPLDEGLEPTLAWLGYTELANNAAQIAVHSILAEAVQLKNETICQSLTASLVRTAI